MGLGASAYSGHAHARFGTRRTPRIHTHRLVPLLSVVVYLGGSPPAAWDFAVTSGLRTDALADSARDPETVLTKYEDFKCNFQATKARCSDQGITFLPLISEGHRGGWSKTARTVWSELANKTAFAMGELETRSSCSTMLRQRLGMVLHRENARACLRRF